jgi:hypothetical protein
MAAEGFKDNSVIPQRSFLIQRFSFGYQPLLQSALLFREGHFLKLMTQGMQYKRVTQPGYRQAGDDAMKNQRSFQKNKT